MAAVGVSLLDARFIGPLMLMSLIVLVGGVCTVAVAFLRVRKPMLG